MRPYYTATRLKAAQLLIPILSISALLLTGYICKQWNWLLSIVYFMVVIYVCVLGGERYVLLRKGYWLQSGFNLSDINDIKTMFLEGEQYEQFSTYVSKNAIGKRMKSIVVYPGDLFFDYLVYVGNDMLTVTVSPDKKKIIGIEYIDSVTI